MKNAIFSNPNKQAQEAYFSKRSNDENSLPITFNNAMMVMQTYIF